MKALKYLSCIILFTIQPISSQNFWQQTNGPYGGATVNDFLLYDDSTIFLATNEGLIKSTDNGNSWNRLNSYKVICLGKDKLNTLYFGISGHLKRSTDGGESWTDVIVSSAAIKDFVINYKDTIVVGSWDAWIDESDNVTITNGVFRSIDYGATWTLINTGIEYPGVYELIILSNGSLLVGTSGGGVYKTTNWGDIWVESNTGLPANSQGYRYAESFIEFAPGQLLTGTHLSIYYSSNYGDSWSIRSNGYNNNIATCFEMNESGTIYAGSDLGDGVYYSTNNGNHWNYLGLGISTRMLGWDSASRLYAGSLSSGLYRYTFEDSSWISVYNQGYTSVEVDNLILTISGNLIAYSQWWGNFYSTNSGEDWTNFNTPEGNMYGTIEDSIFIAGYSNIYVSNDTGKIWSLTGTMSMSSLYFEPNTQMLYLGTRTNCAIHTSSDFGQNWTLLYHFPPLGLVQRITGLHVTRTNHVILAHEYIGSPWGSGYRLHQSNDQGQTWQIIYQDGHSPVSHIVEDIYSNIYALAGYNLLVSEDECKTWITRTIPSSSQLETDNSGRIYSGLSYSTDKGISWHGMDISGLQGGINDIDIDQNDRIYIANGYGIFYAEIENILLSIEKIEQAKTFNLSQNYPNPFNPVTSIQYVVSSRQFVTLKVYDVLGNEVATLVNEEKQPGSYKVEFSSESSIKYPASGIYFYQLRAGSFIETKKMVLLH